MFRASAVPGTNTSFVAETSAGPAGGSVPNAASSAEAKTATLTYWAQRLTAESELTCAREIAGLPEGLLERMASEFKRFPRRKRTDRWRLAAPAGAVLAAAGGIALFLDGLIQPSGGSGVSSVHVLSLVAIAGGLIAGCVGAFAAYTLVSIEMSYARVGLYVSMLNEQHPWLYNTAELTHDTAADAYRNGVLDERGPLRGVDYVMMQEISRARAALERTETAHHVVARVQRSLRPPRVAAEQLAVPASKAFVPTLADRRTDSAP